MEGWEVRSMRVVHAGVVGTPAPGAPLSSGNRCHHHHPEAHAAPPPISQGFPETQKALALPALPGGPLAPAPPKKGKFLWTNRAALFPYVDAISMIKLESHLHRKEEMNSKIESGVRAQNVASLAKELTCVGLLRWQRPSSYSSRGSWQPASPPSKLL